MREECRVHRVQRVVGGTKREEGHACSVVLYRRWACPERVVRVKLVDGEEG